MAERFNEEPKVRRAAPKADPAAASGRANEQDPVLDLQRQAGNRAVSEMLQGSGSGPAGASPALRLRDALRAGRTAVQRELSLNVQRDLKSDTEKKDPSEASNEPVEEKMPSDSTEKLGGEEKVPSDSTDKLGGEEKDSQIGLKPFPADEGKAPGLMPFPGDEQKDSPIGLKPFPADEGKTPGLMPFPGSEEKMPSGNEEKMPFDDEQKMPSDGGGQFGSDEDKMFDEEKLS